MSKIVNPKKNFYNSHVYNVCGMFYYEVSWFYQDFNGKNLCFLNLYLINAAKIQDLSLEIMLSPPKWETKHLSLRKIL